MSFVHPLRRLWDQGGVARGAWCAAPSAVTAEVMARAGFDYVCVDLQHGAVAESDAVTMLQAVSGVGSVGLARVPWNNPGVIGKVLDIGALGVVVPLVSSRADAERAVAACRYPPRGSRSFGPVRAAGVMGSRAVEDLDQVVCAVMVETVEGLENIDEIAGTEGVDAIYVGPADLAVALGLPPSYELDDPEHVQAINQLRRACEQHGIVPGIHCDGGRMAARRAAEGFRMTTLVNDLALLRTAADAELTAAG